MARKTAAGIPAAVRTTATGRNFPWPRKDSGHGAGMHPWPLRLSIYVARGTSADTVGRYEQIAMLSVDLSRVCSDPAATPSGSREPVDQPCSSPQVMEV